MGAGGDTSVSAGGGAQAARIELAISELPVRRSALMPGGGKDGLPCNLQQTLRLNIFENNSYNSSVPFLIIHHGPLENTIFMPNHIMRGRLIWIIYIIIINIILSDWSARRRKTGRIIKITIR